MKKENVLQLIKDTPDVTYIQRDNDPYLEYWRDYAEQERKSGQAFLFIVLLVAFIWAIFGLAVYLIAWS